MSIADYTAYISSGVALGLAFVATAFGYGKINQEVDNLKERIKEDKEEFKEFIETNRQEHEIFFGELRLISKHMGAVETYMKMAEKRRNGKDKP